MNNYAIYLRKSRADVELESIDKFETLSKHEHILMELANKQNLNITKVYKEIVSGESIESRPMMKQLLKDIYEHKYKGVLVVEIERLARGDTKDQGIVAEAFTITNTLIITPTKTFNPNNEFDEEYFEFGLFMSRREYKTISRRMRKGVIESVKSGNYIGSTAPYGYKKIKANKKDISLEIDEEESKVIKMIFDLYTEEHFTMAQISQRLYDLHIPTKIGNVEWGTCSIREKLKNVLYIGKVSWNKRRVFKEYVDGKVVKKIHRTNDNIIIVDGKHEPIISVEQFEKAQALLKKQSPVKSSTELNNILSGLLVCSKCGKSMRLFYNNNKPTIAPRYVHFPSKVCNMKSCKTEEVITAIVEHLKAKIKDYEIAIENLSNSDIITDYENRLKILTTKLRKCQASNDKLFEFLEEGIYTKSDYIRRKDRLSSKMDSINKEIAILTSNKPDIATLENKIISYGQALEKLKEKPTNAREINILLKGVIKRIEYTAKDLGRGKGCDITLDIYYL